MRRTGSLSITLLSLALVAQSVIATEVQLSETARNRLEEAKIRLDLSEEQVELVAPVVMEAFQRQKAVLEAYGLDIEKLGTGDQPKLKFRQARELSKELDGVREKTLRELEEILSPAQVQEYERLQSERKKAIRKELRSRR